MKWPQHHASNGRTVTATFLFQLVYLDRWAWIPGFPKGPHGKIDEGSFLMGYGGMVSGMGEQSKAQFDAQA
jgi:hypothetical protein